jgi:hypothetical protein
MSTVFIYLRQTFKMPPFAAYDGRTIAAAAPSINRHVHTIDEPPHREFIYVHVL